MDKLTLIAAKLNQLPDEKALRERVLVPLFQKMRLNEVTLTHGADEEGKDVVFCREDETRERIYTAVVAKIGNVSGGASKRSSGKERTHLLDNILTQVKQCFALPYDSTVTKRKERIGRVWVVTNGSIKPAARRHITAGLDTVLQAHLKFVEKNQLTELLLTHWQEFGDDIEPTIQDYFDELLGRFGTLSELKTLGYNQTKGLLDVFVAPTLVEERPVPLTRQVTLGVTPPVQFSALQATDLLGMKRVWLDGPGGSGKTTLVRSLVLEILDQNKIAPVGFKLPVVVEFGQVLAALKEGSVGAEAILSRIRKETEKLSKSCKGCAIT